MRASTWPTILIATTNAGKIREILSVVAGAPVRWLTLADRPGLSEPDETGRTFADNAALKAHAYANASGLPTVAEDSGLAIDALDGRPGVMSARYPGSTYPEKFSGLYAELAGHRAPWTARFVSAVAFAEPGSAIPVFTAEGVAHGRIVFPPRGQNGFGYDPIFAYAPGDRTGGELTDAEKLAVSHRGRAFRLFQAWLLMSA